MGKLLHNGPLPKAFASDVRDKDGDKEDSNEDQSAGIPLAYKGDKDGEQQHGGKVHQQRRDEHGLSKLGRPESLFLEGRQDDADGARRQDQGDEPGILDDSESLETKAGGD